MSCLFMRRRGVKKKRRVWSLWTKKYNIRTRFYYKTASFFIRVLSKTPPRLPASPPHLVPVQDHFVTFCHFLEFHTSQYKNTPRFRFCTPFFWRLAVSRGAHVISVCSTAALPLLGHRNVAASSSTHSRFTFACRRYHRHSAQCLPSGVFESCVWCSRFLASL
jgi:hypothetical protein